MAAAGWVRITAAAGEGLPSTGGAGWASCGGWVLLLAILHALAGLLAPTSRAASDNGAHQPATGTDP